MGTEIKAWQIVNKKLTPVNTTLEHEGIKETYDLEPWIASNPEIIGTDILIIGRQVQTNSGPIDLLGLDRSGNTVIIELKRDKLPRESLAQAIDYAANVAEWKDNVKLNEICLGYTKKELDDAFSEAFPDVEQENINYNKTQRIVLVGFFIESSLGRMIEWLSDSYRVNINAIILSYVKTRGNEEHELLMKTTIIPDLVETKWDYPLYWNAFIKFLQEHNSTLKFTGTRNWAYIGTTICKSTASLGAHIYIKSGKIAVQLYITGPKAEYYFKQLQEQKDSIVNQIGNGIGSQLIWKDSAEKTKSVSLFKEDVDFEDRGNWPEQHQWLYENLEVFFKAFAERIKNIGDKDFQADDSAEYPNDGK